MSAVAGSTLVSVGPSHNGKIRPNPPCASVSATASKAARGRANRTQSPEGAAPEAAPNPGVLGGPDD